MSTDQCAGVYCSGAAVMGYEITRFEGEVDEELLCPICSGVLEDPVQVIRLSLSQTVGA